MSSIDQNVLDREELQRAFPEAVHGQPDWKGAIVSTFRTESSSIDVTFYHSWDTGCWVVSLTYKECFNLSRLGATPKAALENLVEAFLSSAHPLQAALSSQREDTKRESPFDSVKSFVKDLLKRIKGK